MNTKDFYYDLPERYIAQKPITPRDHSKLMIVDRKSNSISETIFYNIISELDEGDALVLNDTRVRPARLFGHREDKKESIEVLLLRPLDEHKWDCLVKPGKKMQIGTKIIFSKELLGVVVNITNEGNRYIHFEYSGNFNDILQKLGEMPLPPYITEKLEDKERYQTVYSKEQGSSAAPTAGLHFTKELLSQIKSKGVKLFFITLHVGLGTFRPVKVEDIKNHKMHSELCIVSEETARGINQVKKTGGRIISVGTTTTRTLESMANSEGKLESGSRWTDIFIYPGYRFKIVDALITNFHLPESTLLMLVSALSSKELMMKSYETAKLKNFRFFSFGDAMFIK